MGNTRNIHMSTIGTCGQGVRACVCSPYTRVGAQELPQCFTITPSTCRAQALNTTNTLPVCSLVSSVRMQMQCVVDSCQKNDVINALRKETDVSVCVCAHAYTCAHSDDRHGSELWLATIRRRCCTVASICHTAHAGISVGLTATYSVGIASCGRFQCQPASSGRDCGRGTRTFKCTHVHAHTHRRHHCQHSQRKTINDRGDKLCERHNRHRLTHLHKRRTRTVHQLHP